jgi:cytoskeletal protein CcmA (bactofilin family)
MFGMKKNTEDSALSNPKSNGAAPSTSPGGFNNLVQGTSIEGKVTSDNDFRVDGVIKGSLICGAKVIIGATGFVDGDIKCKSAVVEGRFKGTILVEEMLMVKETAEIIGEVTTDKLSVQSGAVFNVTCNMGRASSSTPQPALKSITTNVNENIKKEAS